MHVDLYEKEVVIFSRLNGLSWQIWTHPNLDHRSKYFEIFGPIGTYFTEINIIFYSTKLDPSQSIKYVQVTKHSSVTIRKVIKK